MVDSDQSPILLWFRRDLRLADHPALHAAAASGRVVVPVFLCDEVVETLGAAPKMRIGMSVAELDRSLRELGSRLMLRRGPALEALRGLADETGARAIWWTRLHDPDSQRRDRKVAEGLAQQDVRTRAFPGHLLCEPETVRTGSGSHYKVFGPFLRNIVGRDPGDPLPAPSQLRGPKVWPDGDDLETWRLDAATNRGGPVVAAWQEPGEVRARARLDRFILERLGNYAVGRDRPAADASSRLSENLTYGEVSARSCWLAAMTARERVGASAEKFLQELAWRDFSHHLLFHEPEIATDSWRPEWRVFPWLQDAESPLVIAWQRGRTGIRMVDAAMREMFVTGRMHNRARMITASLLTKNMLVDWRIGQGWFADCLTDWDPASNAVNWQWVAGSGPDATPFFRIFNPVSQAKNYDKDGAYEMKWIAEGQANAPATALSYFDAIPRSWGMSPDDAYPKPVVDLGSSRDAALAAYREHRRAGSETQTHSNA